MDAEPVTEPFAEAHRLGLHLRPMTDADLPFLFGLYASTRAEEVAGTGWPPEAQRHFLQQQFQAQHHHYTAHYPDAAWLVVERQGAPVGRLYIEEWPSQIRIIDIALIAEARRKGFGAALIADVFRRARAAAKKVSIHVEKNNPAMSLYHRLGFTKAEDKGVYDLLEWRPAEAG
ncbi:MAG TPA: GNAT family N-acetyltransferase [Allosphingosinicella sp.]|jgi:ribosomal protein S18 acetylase RimI-like enzyme